MKKSIFPYLLLLAIFPFSGLKSQDNLNKNFVERVQIITDRTLYISGENIIFTAGVFNQDVEPTDELSRVLYSELITPDGDRISSGKYLFQNSFAEGCLQIPEEAVTGIYYLKSYTRLMRNGNPEDYHYIMLKIINPDKAEVLAGREKIDSVLISKPPVENATLEEIKISADKIMYLAGEKVKLEITGNSSVNFPNRLSLVVVPDATNEAGEINKIQTVPNVGNGQYYPETRGVSISGRVINKKTGQPIPEIKVNLSIIDNKDMMVIRTDSAGMFFFALPDNYGNHDIFLCAEDLAGISTQLFIDNDFCTRPVTLASPFFDMNEEEKTAALKMAINHKINNAFRTDSLIVDTVTNQSSVSFYGTPAKVFILDDYIDLPTLEEYFNELPMTVKVKKNQGRKFFSFYNSQSEMSIYDPLVLIDWVAVDDIDRVLAMSPREIERIELINTPFVKGEIIYGGIISFVSKNADFAGIDLPNSGTFINYSFLEICNPVMPSENLNTIYPDSRNTIYWNPALETNIKGKTEIIFTAPETPGKYVVLLRTLDRTGNISGYKTEFEVSVK